MQKGRTTTPSAPPFLPGSDDTNKMCDLPCWKKLSLCQEVARHQPGRKSAADRLETPTHASRQVMSGAASGSAMSEKSLTGLASSGS